MSVLLIGDPRLREVARPVEALDPADSDRLIAELTSFRETHGFGRAIAAPQLGIPRRLIAMNLGDGPFIVVNPEIVWRSDETFTMWDDCMSFPWLFVKVRRHASISVVWTDAHGRAQTWERLARAESELLQHEIDHLDGILAVDRAVDRDALVSRDVLEADRDRFAAMVDYVIPASGRSPAAR